MILKIVSFGHYDETDEAEGQDWKKDTFFEGWPIHAEWLGNEAVKFTVEGRDRTIEILVSRSEPYDVYLMNQQGKTVDSYRFATVDEKPVERFTKNPATALA